MKLPRRAQKNDYLKMAPCSADQVSVWVQSYVLTSVKEVKFCYSLTHPISENTLRNKTAYFVFPIHSKSTGKFLEGKKVSFFYSCSRMRGQPSKSLEGLNCMYIVPWTLDSLQYPLEVELKVNIWIKYVPSAWWQSQNSTIILLSFIHHLSTFRRASIYAEVLVQKLKCQSQRTWKSAWATRLMQLEAIWNMFGVNRIMQHQHL